MDLEDDGTTASSYHEIALLIDGLRSDDVGVRLESSNSLIVISEGLGPDRTRGVSGQQLWLGGGGI